MKIILFSYGTCLAVSFRLELRERSVQRVDIFPCREYIAANVKLLVAWRIGRIIFQLIKFAFQHYYFNM